MLSSPPPALWLWCLCLNSPGVGGICLAAVTGVRGCSTFIQPGESLWGTSPFPFSSCLTGGTSSSSAGLLMVAAGMVGALMGSPAGAASLVVTSVGPFLHWALL